MKTDKFIEYLKRREIPPRAPNCASIFGQHYPSGIDDWHARDTVTQDFGMWAIVAREWTKPLAEWIGARKCLEIMAGVGWLAKALSEEGANIIATDNRSTHQGKNPFGSVHPIESLEASAAVKKYADEIDILIVSWPPYGNMDVVKAIEALPSGKIVIYIGEKAGGCNAPDEMWKLLWNLDNAPEFYFLSWCGIHDSIEFHTRK